ncbi:MAG TPA: hypothetical protein VGO17_16245 [Aurantimonas sp.]|jgi:hypothetical protein|nr:hypothetical protein [Aurantimonas sp.]
MKRYIVLGLVLLYAAFFLSSIFEGGAVGTDWLKSLFIPLAVLYLDAFNSASTAIFLCIAMIAAAIVLTLYYWRARIAPARRLLSETARDLEAIKAAPGTREALYGIDNAMARHPALLRPWTVYRATLIVAPNGRVSAQFPPDRYFDMKAMEQAGIRLRFFLGLPNDFVGLGLIFTFLGLVAGLYFATRSMMSADLGAAREALVLLLHAATFKFLTSVTGIGLSLVLSWTQRALVDRLESNLHDVQFFIEQKLPINLAEPIPFAEPAAGPERRSLPLPATEIIRDIA